MEQLYLSPEKTTPYNTAKYDLPEGSSKYTVMNTYSRTCTIHTTGNTLYNNGRKSRPETSRINQSASRAIFLIFVLGLMLGIVNETFSQTTQTFTSNGTFTVPASATKVEVHAWGGGGGGGAATVPWTGGTGRGGGGAGGAFTRAIAPVTPNDDYSIIVGSGGTGGTGGNNNATAGGATSFGALVSADGGARGLLGSNGNGAGGATTTGGAYNGGAGAAGSSGGTNPGSGGGGGAAGSGGHGGDAVQRIGGSGGSGTIPGGAGADGANTNSNGANATAISGGGAGGYYSAGWFNAGTRDGGSGFRGQVIVSWITANVTASATTVEYGTNINLNGNPTGGSAYNHAWTGTGASYLNNTNTATPAFGTAPVGSYELTYTVTDSRGCEAVSTISVTVTQKPLTPNITAENKCYDETTDANLLSQTLTGVVGSDAVNLMVGSSAFSTAGPGNGITVTASGLSLSGAAASNYSLASTTANTTANIYGLPGFSFTKSDITCFAAGDGQIIINPSEGSGEGYEFQYRFREDENASWNEWSDWISIENDFENLQAGQYELQIKDSFGCVQTECE